MLRHTRPRAPRASDLARASLRPRAPPPCQRAALCRASQADCQAAMQQAQAAMAAMRADPQLSRVLDSPRVQAALAAVRADPAAIAAYRGDPDVMAVLGRLVEVDLAPTQVQGFADVGTSPAGLLATLAGEPGLAAALAAPRVRAALAEMRADPEAAMARWQHDAEVMDALDRLEAALAAGGGGQQQRGATGGGGGALGDGSGSGGASGPAS